MVHGIKHIYYETQLASTLLMRYKSEDRIAVKIAATLNDPSSVVSDISVYVSWQSICPFQTYKEGFANFPHPLFRHALHHCGLFLRCQSKGYFLILITVKPLANELTQRVKTKRWHHLKRHPSYYRGRDCINNVSHLQEPGNCLKWRAVNWHGRGITQVIRKERVCGIYSLNSRGKR